MSNHERIIYPRSYPERLHRLTEKYNWEAIPATEITRRRLGEVYKLSHHFLDSLYLQFGGKLDVLDVGSWGGEFDTDILKNPSVGLLYGIDIQQAKVNKAKTNPKLSEDIKNGRYIAELMDGTATTYPDNSFHFRYEVEVLVGLQGDLEGLFRDRRTVKPGGITMVTFQDKGMSDFYKNFGFTPGKATLDDKKRAYDNQQILELHRKYAGDSVRVIAYGQLPNFEMGTEDPYLLPYANGTVLVREGAFTPRHVYNENGQMNFVPSYWIHVVTKPL